MEGGPGWSHDERISGERAKKYPFLCLTNHPRWRVHSQHDDMQWLREIDTCKIVGPDGYAYQTMWINPKDAEKKKIKHGDVVRVFNERGSVLLGAYVTERLMPGVLYVDHGARFDPIGEKDLDRGGAINTITPAYENFEKLRRHGFGRIPAGCGTDRSGCIEKTTSRSFQQAI